MVTASGPSQRMVSRVWRAFALQPHRNETFERSKDLLFVEKVRDIAESCLNPLRSSAGTLCRREVAPTAAPASGSA